MRRPIILEKRIAPADGGDEEQSKTQSAFGESLMRTRVRAMIWYARNRINKLKRLDRR
jgi:hypothetical protein